MDETDVESRERGTHLVSRVDEGGGLDDERLEAVEDRAVWSGRLLDELGIAIRALDARRVALRRQGHDVEVEVVQAVVDGAHVGEAVELCGWLTVSRTFMKACRSECALSRSEEEASAERSVTKEHVRVFEWRSWIRLRTPHQGVRLRRSD